MIFIKPISVIHQRVRKSLLLFLFGSVIISFSGFAQNTKGDRPFSNQQQVREAKSRLKTQKRTEKANSILPKRIQSSKRSPSSRASNVYPQPNTYSGRKSKNPDKPAKPINQVFNNPPDESRSRAWKGDVYGNKIRTNTQTARQARKKSNIYPQPEPYKKYLSKKSKKNERPWRGDFQGSPVVKRYPKTAEKPYTGPLEKSSTKGLSQSGKINNVYSQQGPSKKSISKKLKKEAKATLTTASGDLPIRVFPRQSENLKKSQVAFGNAYSASHSFIVRRKKNVYWGKFRKSEKAFTRDIAGLRLRRKNYSSKLPPLTPQDKSLYKNRNARGKASLSSQLGLSTPGKRDNAWIGDPNRSKTRKSKFRNIEVPGFNRYIIKDTYSKKANRLNTAIPAKGWLSISGTRGASKPLPPTGQVDAGANFSGAIKRKTIKSFSTESYSFSGNTKSNKFRRGFDPSAASFSGNTKGMRRPLKGGGSISGYMWNNKNKSITDKLATDHDISHSYSGFIKGKFARPAYETQGADFSGKIKFVKPEKGGGSISGNSWNNGQKPVTRLRNHAYQGFDFSGNMKTIKPQKGGESMSGQLWNNKERPLAGTYAKNPRISVATSGKIPLSKFKRDYIQNPNAAILSNKKKRPTEGALAVNGFKSKMKQGDYQRKPKAAESAMSGLAPGKSTVRASAFGGKSKMTREYVHNPKSAALALKVLSQPKAYAKIGDYQGNMKMRKPTGKDLHPDAKFAHLGQSNIKTDRTIFTNIKLIWAKMFKKGENQPEAAKTNEHPLRYDRKEKDLWKALYDYTDVKK